jgi:hypothetical protein
MRFPVVSRISFSPKGALWRLATRLAPLPTMVRPKSSATWQAFWGQRKGDEVLSLYADQRQPHRDWLASQIIALKPATVVEFGSNIGSNLLVLAKADPSLKLYGVELNQSAVELGQQSVPSGSDILLVNGSMATASEPLQKAGVSECDIVFTSAAAMHVDDDIFAAAKKEALKLARKAIVHLEFNAWTPAEMMNARRWRGSFMSDRWIRDYVAEYEGLPGVDRIECLRIPPSFNIPSNIGKLMVNDMTGLIIVHLK